MIYDISNNVTSFKYRPRVSKENHTTYGLLARMPMVHGTAHTVRTVGDYNYLRYNNAHNPYTARECTRLLIDTHQPFLHRAYTSLSDALTRAYDRIYNDKSPMPVYLP